MIRAAVSGLLASAAVVVGCAAPRPPSHPSDVPLIQSDSDPARPAVMGASNGLEMRVWAVEEQDGLLAGLIERHGARPTPLPDSARTAWRASGLRVLAVPIDELSGARDGLRLVAPEQRDWFGQSPGWSEIARGRVVAGGSVIRVADGLMATPAGRLRVLMRCWPVPGERAERAGLHLELAVQLERRDAVPSSFELPALRDELEAGVVFPGLRTAMRAEPGDALLIIPVSPEFSAEEEPSPAAGPSAPMIPTLGEAMLTSLDPGSIDPVRRRAVLVLIPRLPERFSLSARQAPAP